MTKFAFVPRMLYDLKYLRDNSLTFYQICKNWHQMNFTADIIQALLVNAAVVQSHEHQTTTCIIE